MSLPHVARSMVALVEDRAERVAQVRQLAEQLLETHGLFDWTFGFNRRKRALGMCFFSERHIELSLHFVERNGWGQILDTLLHEIAHALIGAKHGHDRVWQQKCMEVGALTERCGKAAMPAGRWQARCGTCRKCFHRYRRPKRLHGWYCGDCGLERGGLTWQRC